MFLDGESLFSALSASEDESQGVCVVKEALSYCTFFFLIRGNWGVSPSLSLTFAGNYISSELDLVTYF